MDEIEDVNKDINVKKLAFISSNREKFNFNKFRMPLNFLSSIYNDQNTLKEAQFLQKDLCDEINELKHKYKLKNVKEEEEIYGVLMQADDMLAYRDKIIESFRHGTFFSEHLKRSYDAAYDYVLKDVEKFIQKIQSMAENINLSFFEEFF